jgi:hypothetical protein
MSDLVYVEISRSDRWQDSISDQENDMNGCLDGCHSGKSPYMYIYLLVRSTKYKSFDGQHAHISVRAKDHSNTCSQAYDKQKE